MSKTVEEYLDGVSYSNDEYYVPSKFALEFVTFIKLVNGGSEENKTPVLHYKMLDTVASGNRDMLNMVFRGAAKTTLMGEYMILYLATFSGKFPKKKEAIKVGMYISDSMDNGVKNMRKNLEYRWQNSDFLQEYVPQARFIADEWEFVNKDGHELLFRGYGAKSGVRGFKAYGIRPQIALMDDLISDEDARSATIIESVEAVVHKAVDFALGQHAIKIWSGTPFNQSDPLYKATESGAWAVNVFPVCETFPCTKEEFKGGWEDRFTYEEVKVKYDSKVKQGQVSAFNQELMLRILSDEERVIPSDKINWYNHNSLLKNKGNFNFYITTDFATSEKESADFSFISVWAYNNKGYWFWVDGICARQTMDKNIDSLFKLVSKYLPMSVGIEITGQQGGFIPWIQKEMMERNIFFNLAGTGTTLGIKPTTDKLERFNVVVPWFNQGKMWFPLGHTQVPAVKEMLNELKLATIGGFKSKHDDAIDTISMLALMDVFKPNIEGEGQLNENDVFHWGNEKDSDVSNSSSYFV